MTGDPGADLIVGTAGHIDHGKTSLVRTLTGIDLDALPEEQRRGITIALGHTALELADGRRAAFVDVPGHERLVRTMVAGATGVDAVLLCVSSLDGVMPQTREHLSILELLGVEVGAVVLTMADLVDDELLELAEADVADVVTGTFLEGSPIIPFSAVTGQGREDVMALIATFASARRELSGVFRLPVDRAFVRSGFGTVATGTAWSGTLADGSTVWLLPGDDKARVRGLQAHGQPAKSVQAGWRVAVNLAGIDRDAVPRGTVVAGAPIPCPFMIDVRYQHLDRAPALEDGTQVRMLLGTCEALGRLHFADDIDELLPGRSVWAQIRLDTPLPCLPGDRFVVRRPSPADTIGGGEIVDPWAGRMRHRRRVSWGEQIGRLHGGDAVVWLERASEQGLSPGEWRGRAGDRSDLGAPLGDRVFAPGIVGRLEGELLSALQSYHAQRPLSLGANRRELRRGRLGHLGDRVFDALVGRLAAVEMVCVEGPLVRFNGFEVVLTDEQRLLRQAIVGGLDEVGVTGLTTAKLHERFPQPETAALLHLMEKDGTAVQVSGIGFVGAGALDALRRSMAGWFAEHDTLTPGDLKQLTGLSRKTAIPLLEWLDASGLTRRRGDKRVAGPALQAK